MKKLTLSMSCTNYDRTAALFDGRVQVEGVDLISSQLEPEESFHRAFRSAEFDICEISLSSHTMMTSRGTHAYVGVPAFVSRLFRHSGVYIRGDRGIRTPADLAGKKWACRSTKSRPMCGYAASCKMTLAWTRPACTGAAAAWRKPVAVSARRSSCQPP